MAHIPHMERKTVKVYVNSIKYTILALNSLTSKIEHTYHKVRLKLKHFVFFLLARETECALRALKNKQVIV